MLDKKKQPVALGKIRVLKEVVLCHQQPAKFEIFIAKQLVCRGESLEDYQRNALFPTPY